MARSWTSARARWAAHFRMLRMRGLPRSRTYERKRVVKNGPMRGELIEKVYEGAKPVTVVLRNRVPIGAWLHNRNGIVAVNYTLNGTYQVVPTRGASP